MVVNFAWQTRQRRLQTAGEGKSKIPPVVGREHVNLGRWLTGGVVGIALIGLAYPIFEHILDEQVGSKNPSQVIFIVLMFAATIASLVLLYRAKQRHWRGIFATLTGMGLVVLGCQDGVFRRTNEWYWSHYLLYWDNCGTADGIFVSDRGRYLQGSVKSLALRPHYFELFCLASVSWTRDDWHKGLTGDSSLVAETVHL